MMEAPIKFSGNTSTELLMYANDWDEHLLNNALAIANSGSGSSWGTELVRTNYISDTAALRCPTWRWNLASHHLGARDTQLSGVSPIKHVRLAGVEDSSSTFWLVDSIYFGSLAGHNGFQYSQLRAVYNYGMTSTSHVLDWNTAPHVRHAGTANWWFIDGHVESLTPDGFKDFGLGTWRLYYPIGSTGTADIVMEQL